MSYYLNRHFAAAAVTTSGPYTFKFGLISTSEENDKELSHILTTYYSCEKVSKADAEAILKKGKAAQAKLDADAEIKAKEQVEAEAKEKAEAAATAAAKAEAEAKAAKDAADKANDSAAAKL